AAARCRHIQKSKGGRGAPGPEQPLPSAAMTDDGAGGYDEMADGYARFWGPVVRPAPIHVLDLVATRLDAGDDAHILDVGSGTGSLAIAALQRWPGHRV